MNVKFSEERSSEDTSVATKRSLATAESGSFPIHSVQLLLRSEIPERVKLEAKRKTPAMRAVEGRCCPGIKKERARIGSRYGRWAKMLTPDEEA